MMWYLPLMGKQFAYGGRGPFAYDCYGLLLEAWKLYHGEVLRDYETLMSEMDSPDMRNTLYAEYFLGAQRVGAGWKRIPEPVEGCAVIFRLNFPLANHIGIVVTENSFLHIRPKTLSCVERLNAPIWSRVVEGYFTR